MKKIQLSHRMYSIHDLKRLNDSGELRIQPKYQRRRTPWPAIAKTSLIDTIVSNYPIPPIYFHNYVDEDRRRRSEVIDGQQRLTTIFDFLEDKFPLSSNFSDEEYSGFSFSNLPNEIQDHITEYEFSCMAIRGASESDIVAIFSKMNSFSLPLNEQEKRNAIYAGDFKTTVYALASEYYTFWKDFNILTDSSIARMKDAELVSEIFSVIKNGLKGIDRKKINTMYAHYDNAFLKKNYYRKMFEQILSYIGTLFENEDLRIQFRKVSWFFPLFLVIYKQYYGELGSLKLELKKTPNLKLLEEKLLTFIDRYKRGSLPIDTKLLFQQGSKSPSKIEQRMSYLLSVINEKP